MNDTEAMVVEVKPGIISAEYNFYITSEEYTYLSQFAGGADEIGFQQVDINLALQSKDFRDNTPVFEIFGSTMNALWGPLDNLAINVAYVIHVEIGNEKVAVEDLHPMIITIIPPIANAAQLRELVKQTEPVPFA